MCGFAYGLAANIIDYTISMNLNDFQCIKCHFDNPYSFILILNFNSPLTAFLLNWTEDFKTIFNLGRNQNGILNKIFPIK